MAQTHEPLTSERLAEIRESVEDMQKWGPLASPTTAGEFADMCEELLAALAAAEAREAALVEASRQMLDALERAHKRSVLSKTASLLLNDAGATLRRALLAATEAVEGEE